VEPLETISSGGREKALSRQAKSRFLTFYSKLMVSQKNIKLWQQVCYACQSLCRQTRNKWRTDTHTYPLRKEQEEDASEREPPACTWDNITVSRQIP